MVRVVEPMPARSMFTFVGSVPLGAYVLATETVNCTSPWKAGTAETLSPV